MPEASDRNTRLRRIHALAREAAALSQLPDRAVSILIEIESLSAASPGDTPEPSDIPETENQTL